MSNKRIPNLWRIKEDAERLYSLLIVRLMMQNNNQRIIQVCRQIRRHATQGPGIKHGLFTFNQEINALCELGNFHTAWRQLQLLDRLFYGKPVNYAKHQWNDKEGWQLVHDHAPLLYFTNQLALGCMLMEKGLGFWFKNCQQISYELLYNVFNPADHPNLHQVSLRHFYERMGKDLSEWSQWNRFVSDFPAKLFRAVGISQSELKANSKKMRPFVRRIAKLKQERCISGCTQGIKDVVDNPRKVRHWQEQTIKKDEMNEKQNEERRASFDTKLKALFPELRMVAS